MVGVGMVLSGSDVVRRNLPVAFRQTHGEFLALRSTLHDQNAIGDAASLFNFAALLEWFIGRAGNASTLCRLQMMHHAQFLERERDTQRLANLVLAWINAERLRIRSGQHAEVRANILSLLAWSGEASVRIGSVTISCGDWRRFLEAGSRHARLFAFCFVEGLKSFEASGDLEGALAFIERCAVTPPAGRDAIEEARICVYGKLGRWADGLRHALTCAATRSQAVAPLFRLHAADLQLRLGRRDLAVEMLLDLCPGMTDRNLRDPSPVSMRQIIEATRLAVALGLRDVAYDLAKSAWAGAERMGDEIFAIDVACLLASLSTGDERQHWRSVDSRLRRETLYAQVAVERGRRRSPPVANGEPHEGRLFEDLVAAISTPIERDSSCRAST